MQLQRHQVRNLDERIRIIKRNVLETNGGIYDPRMRELGLAVTRSCPARNDLCELRAIYDFIVKNVRYTGDIYGKDTYQTPLRTLHFKGGDCDDHVALAAVLAMENGFAAKARVTSNTGSSWDHIYAMVGLPKGRTDSWIALDTTLGPGRFGREPGRAKHRDFILAKDTG